MPEAETAPEPGKPDAPPPEKRKPLWPWFAAGVVVLGFLVAVVVILTLPHTRQKTDDAYVTAHYASIAPRVSGQVVAVLVGDNARVQASQPLVALDDRDYRTALAEARASLDGDIARVADAQAQLVRQPALIGQAAAQVASAAAHLRLSRIDDKRFADLAAAGAGTVRQGQQSEVAVEEDLAALVSARAQLAAQTDQTASLRAQVDAARARVASDRARTAQAELNLSYTHVVAPLDGSIDQRTVQVGDYVAAGTAMMVVVPLQDVYVLANYRELALRHMRAGQRAVIHLDAYDVDLEGVVQSLPPASGTAYAPIAPNNATGNFTKIVQRLPVKIVVAPNQPLARLLRVGLSVETTVDTGLEDVAAEQRRVPARATVP